MAVEAASASRVVYQARWMCSESEAKVGKVFLQEHSHVHICTYMCGGSPESVMGITLAVDLGTTGAREVHTENVI